jgi:predicted secreted protein
MGQVTSFFFIFFVTWWVVIFTVLPFGVDVSNQPEEGHASSAPKDPKLKKKFLMVTALSLIISTAAHYVIFYTDISIFR